MSGKAYKGIGMNGFIAKWYAKTVEKDYQQYLQLADRIGKTLAGEKAILEIASGPGFLAIELAKKPDFNVTGLDISETFVQIAKYQAKKKQVTAKFVVGNVSDMPFKEAQFDFIICRAAFKNFAKPLEAINEMFRVLKPGGKTLIIDLRRDITDEEIASCVKEMKLNSKWDSMLTFWAFKLMLRKRAYSIEQIEQLIAISKFKNNRIDKTFTGFELWLEK